MLTLILIISLLERCFDQARWDPKFLNFGNCPGIACLCRLGFISSAPLCHASLNDRDRWFCTISGASVQIFLQLNVIEVSKLIPFI